MAQAIGRSLIVSGVNVGFLLGRLCARPEELSTKNGKRFLKAIIATSIHQKNGDGVSEERTSFIPVTIFGRTAEIFGQYVQKGDMVHLAGRLDSSEYTTTSGEKRLILSFIAETVNLLPNERAKAQQMPGPKLHPQPQQRRAEASQSAEPRRSQPTLNEYGEPNDIPF
jgi:single-strand DNA-binding protein